MRVFSRTKNPSVLVCPFLTAKFFLVVGRYFQFLPCVVHIGEKKGKILPTCIFVFTYIDFLYLCLNGVTVLTSYSIDNIKHISKLNAICSFTAKVSMLVSHARGVY